LAVNDLTQVKINLVCSNLDPGTKAEAILRDRSRILDSKVSRALSGSGEYTFAMAKSQKKLGAWMVEGMAHNVAR
jgi:hypothetical protein